MSAAGFPFTEEQMERFEQVRNGGESDAPPIPPAPEWPDVLPPVVSAYTGASALSIGVPREMVEVPFLVFAGGIIGNAVQLRLKRGWNELPTLWAGGIGDPGHKKTPSQSAAQWPINELQRRAHERYVQERAQFEADMDTWANTTKAERGEKPEAPTLQHLFTTDITIEKLVDTLQQERGITVIRDELSGFIASLNKYHAGDDRQQYLSLWSGTVIKSDRKGGGTAFAYRPAAGIYGGIQPDVANKLHNENGERDGMVERFLLFRPEVYPSGWTDDEVDYDLLPPVTELLGRLRSIAIREDLDGDRITVQLHPDAKRNWVEWFNSNEVAVRQVSGLRAGFYSKLPSQVARIALTLHCLKRAGDPRVMLDDETMGDAIAVGEYFREHLNRVLPLIGDASTGEPVGLAARILRYLRTPDLQDTEGWVRRGDLYNRLRNISAPALSDELRSLEGRGAVESRTVPTGTKPSEQWRIIPAPRSYNFDFSDYSASEVENQNNTNCKNGHSPGAGADKESVLVEMTNWSDARKGSS